jgi:hypothetical protein
MYGDNEDGIKCSVSGISSNPNGYKKWLMFTHFIKKNAKSFLPRFQFSFHKQRELKASEIE